jgi:ankyrin repeat protein
VTLLHAFSAHEDARGVDWLLEHGADTAARDANGCTPLHHVGRRNRGIKVAKLLLAAGACVAALDDDGYTPIQLCKTERPRSTSGLDDWLVECLLTI